MKPLVDRPAELPPVVDPLSASTGGRWSRASVAALISGRTVLLDDRVGNSAIAPQWLADIAAEIQSSPRTLADELLRIHPLDRGMVAAAWVDASTIPGELTYLRYRARSEDGLRWFEDTYLDLLGHDGLALITVRADLGPAPGLEQWADLESALESAATPASLEYFDQAGIVTSTGGRVQEIFGRPPAEIVGHFGLEFIDERYHDAVATVFVNLIAEPGRVQSIRMEVLRPDESRIWVESTLVNRLDDERIAAIISITHDITDQLATERARHEQDEELRRSHQELRLSHEKLRQSHEAFESLANRVPAGVFRAESDGAITFANERWHRLAGKGPTQNLRDVVLPEDQKLLDAMMGRLGAPDGPGEISIEVRSRDSDRVFSLSCQSVGGTGRHGLVPVIGSMSDVTSTTELRHLAQHDDLTGLLNRPGIERRLHQALAEDDGDVLLAFIDLDGFKAVNDETGHEAGDEVLRMVAARLRRAVRPADDVARYGGDEFVVLCRGAAVGAEVAVTARIQDVLVEPIDLGVTHWLPRASIGVARALPGEALASLVRRADQAMYEIKRANQEPNP